MLYTYKALTKTGAQYSWRITKSTYLQLNSLKIYWHDVTVCNVLFYSNRIFNGIRDHTPQLTPSNVIVFGDY